MQTAQRHAALAVMRVMAGANVSAALADGDLSGGDRALAQELTYGTLRHYGTLRALVRALANKPIADEPVAMLVAVALYQLEHTRAPAFAIVNHAVATTAALGHPAAKGLVNAMLRRFLRERAALLARVHGDPVAHWSYPRWWIDRVRSQYPDVWQDVLAAGNERPPLTLRVNVRVTTRDDLLRALAADDIAAEPVGAHGIIVSAPRAVTELPGYADGAFSVQDAGAQLAAPLLAVENGMRVLDACAAPGGKATHVAELADAEIVAVDASEGRLVRVRENFARLRLPMQRVSIVAADAGDPKAWWNGKPFHRILADVPCTASGVVRRHPDAKWLRREADLDSFSRQQRILLDGLWPLLAPGGLLLYATCSVFAEENEAQVTSFAARHPDVCRDPLAFPPEALHRDGQLLPSLPGAGHNQDGFFYALLRKA